MANINEIIEGLGKSNFYVIKQEMSFEYGKFTETDKVCIGYFSGKEIKTEYVKHYRSARIDGMKPTVTEFVGDYKGVPQIGLKIDSTEVTYWLLKDNHNWMEVYSGKSRKVKTITQTHLDHQAIVPSKGYIIEWNKDRKLWDVFGLGKGGSPIYVGSTKYAKAIDLTWKVWASGGWHANVLRIDSDEQTLPDDAVDITNGYHEGQEVLSSEYAIFTSMGETYAKGSFASTHKD